MRNDEYDHSAKSVRRVLVADEDADFLHDLKDAWRDQVSEVFVAKDTEEVLNILYDGEFDLLMMGLGLGPQNGVEVAEWVHMTYPKLPVIFMAEPSYLEVDGRLRRVSSYPVLSKPFDLKVLDSILDMAPSEN
jgi:DNA-binding response OmpR family regulator